MTIARTEQEELFLMAETLRLRRAGDPLRTFTPHAKQQAFIDSVLQGKKKENWFIAANRSGKSDAGAYIGATLARFGRQDEPRAAPHAGAAVQVRDRATSGWVSALDFPTARDVIQPKYFDNGYGNSGGRPSFIPKHEIEHWHVDNQVLKLKNGSIIGFKSAESGRKKYQGADKDWFHMDEEHPWEIYEESVIRVGAKPLKFFCTATILPPEGAQQTVSWVFPKIIQPWKSGLLRETGLFGAAIYDNPVIPRDEIARLESIYPEGSIQNRIRLKGEWLPGLGGARAYPSFDRQLHVKTWLPPIARRRPLAWIWDFNVEPMVSLVGQEDVDVYRIYKELILEQGSVPEMCELFMQYFPDHDAEIMIYGDATGKRREGQTAQTSYWTILNEMKNYGVPIKMMVPEENPRVGDRINAVNRVMRDEDGRIRFEVEAMNEELITDLEGVLRDPRTQGILKIRNRKDPYFRRTHTSDALGYWLSFEEPVRIEGGRSRRVPKSLSGPSYGTRRLS